MTKPHVPKTYFEFRHAMFEAVTLWGCLITYHAHFDKHHNLLYWKKQKTMTYAG